MAASAQLSLIDLFRDFYSEIVRQKARIARLQGDYAPLQGEAPPEANTSAVTLAQEIRGILLTILQAQAATAVRAAGSFGLELYTSAQYVMAVVADEVFLNLEWSGRSEWRLLESTLFQTHSAGEVFFQRVDDLLRQGDTARTDMATIYFTALALGFKGRYRGAEGQGHIDDYRRRLFALIHRRSPDQINRQDVLLPQTYVFTTEGATHTLLPDPKRWFALLAAIIIIWLVVTSFLWASVTDRVARTADCIQDPTQNCVVVGGGE